MTAQRAFSCFLTLAVANLALGQSHFDATLPVGEITHNRVDASATPTNSRDATSADANPRDPIGLKFANNSFVVDAVEVSGRAGRAGILVGDVVVSIDGRPVHEVKEFTSRFGVKSDGKILWVIVERAGELLPLAIPSEGPGLLSSSNLTPQALQSIGAALHTPAPRVPQAVIRKQQIKKHVKQPLARRLPVAPAVAEASSPMHSNTPTPIITGPVMVSPIIRGPISLRPVHAQLPPPTVSRESSPPHHPWLRTVAPSNAANVYPRPMATPIHTQPSYAEPSYIRPQFAQPVTTSQPASSPVPSPATGGLLQRLRQRQRQRQP